MAGPKAPPPVTPTARWNVSKFNRRGVAHWWVDSPLNTQYVRSHCGKIEIKRDMKGMEHAIAYCKVCTKALMKEAANGMEK